MKGRDFVFHCVHLLYYKCHEMNFKRGGSYMDFPDWIKNRELIKNPINKKDHKCFQYAVTVALNHEEIKKYLQRTFKIKSFIKNYNWEEYLTYEKKMIGKKLKT